MEVQTKARYLHMSPRKVRYVIDMVRGMSVDQARRQLAFSKKHAAGFVLKALETAVADAKHNFHIEDSSILYIKRIMADGGPVLQRWRARAFGRAAPIQKPMAHLTLVLDAHPIQKMEKVEEGKKRKIRKTV
jgi:large subunit ribosomal protein L22